MFKNSQKSNQRLSLSISSKIKRDQPQDLEILKNVDWLSSESKFWFIDEGTKNMILDVVGKGIRVIERILG